MAYAIDRINIRNSSEEIEFSYKGGEWSRSVTIMEEDDESKEETTSIGTCAAEDVIVALLLNMSHEDTDISACKGSMGTLILAQTWLPRDAFRPGDGPSQPYLNSKVARNYLGDPAYGDTLVIE